MRFADVTTTSTVPARRRSACTPCRRALRATPFLPAPGSCGALLARPGPAGLPRRPGRPGPGRPDRPSAPAHRLVPPALQGPELPGRQRAGRPRWPALVPRHDALVPPTVGGLPHDPQEALARLLAGDDDAVGLRTRARERRRAREARPRIRPAMTIARPYTSSPFVDVADRRIRGGAARTRCPKRDMCPRFRMVERRCGQLGTDSSPHGEGWRASARIPTWRPWSRSARSSRSSIPSSARAPARPSPTRLRPHGAPRARAGARPHAATRAPAVPVLGARHRRALAPRPRDPHRRRRDPARAGHAPPRPAGRGRSLLQGARPRRPPSRPGPALSHAPRLQSGASPGL